MTFSGRLLPVTHRQRSARSGLFHHDAYDQKLAAEAPPIGIHDPLWEGLLAASFLLIPVLDMNGNLIGAQSIDPNDRKSYPRGGRVKGGSHLLGDLATPGSLLIAEGFISRT